MSPKELRRWRYIQYLLETAIELRDSERSILIVAQDCLLTGALDPQRWSSIQKLGQHTVGLIPYSSTKAWLSKTTIITPLIHSYPKLRLVNS